MSICSNRANCRPAQLCYYDLLDAKAAESVPDDVHEHVASCTDCQADIDRLRDVLASAGKKTGSEQSRRDSAVAELLSLHFGWVDELVACAQVKPFLPSLADPLLRIRIPTPITVHVENCPACFQELEALRDAALTHTQLCRLSRLLADDLDADAEIAEIRAAFPPMEEMLARADSGIATRFSFGESADADSGDLDATRPIEVEVIDGRRASAADWQHVLIVNLKRYIGPAIAAAAVVLLGLALLFNGTAASAVSLELIESAIKGADNIYVLQFLPGDTEPVQERWVSRSGGIYMTRTGEQLVLWDVANGLMKRKEHSGALTEVVTLGKDRLDAIKREINGTLGITPFGNGSARPPDSKWGRVPDGALEAEFQDYEAYDLTWTQRRDSSGDSVSWRWRCFLEPGSGLPSRARYYRRPSSGEDYVPDRDRIVEYGDERDIRAAVEGAGF